LIADSRVQTKNLTATALDRTLNPKPKGTNIRTLKSFLKKLSKTKFT